MNKINHTCSVPLLPFPPQSQLTTNFFKRILIRNTPVLVGQPLGMARS